MRPVVLVIMDGVGIGRGDAGDAVARANMPNLRTLLASCPHTQLKAHGTAVGLPSDSDIGNSEVGHNTLGCGQVYNQGAKLINESIATGRMWQSRVWRQLVENCLSNRSTMHFLGLLSDGNVHSHMDHLIAMLQRCRQEGIKRARVHILLDGRDVPPTSAPLYVERLEQALASMEGVDYRIATGGGRMKITMDRYEADWDMVRRGWDTHVLARGRVFPGAMEAIRTLRQETPGLLDQDMEPFIVGEREPMKREDSLILFNFRGDRAIEISKAFDSEDFDKFDRGDDYPRLFAGILQYDSDSLVPTRYLLEPPQIENTLTQLLNRQGIAQYAVSETQKFGHVTYFWNGNRSGRQNEQLETFCEIPSDNISFNRAPAMKSAQIAAAMVENILSGRYGFLRCNFPNGDMVGHTGDLAATIEGLEAVDGALGQILEACKKTDAILLVTADHGNADDMITVNKDGSTDAKTSHSLNPVPFLIYDGRQTHPIVPGRYGLANVAATVCRLLGLEVPAMWEKSMIM